METRPMKEKLPENDHDLNQLCKKALKQVGQVPDPCYLYWLQFLDWALDSGELALEHERPAYAGPAEHAGPSAPERPEAGHEVPGAPGGGRPGRGQVGGRPGEGVGPGGPGMEGVGPLGQPTKRKPVELPKSQSFAKARPSTIS